MDMIGGLAVGEGHKLMSEVTNYCTSLLPLEKPRYLMGVGYPKDILEVLRMELICLIVFYLLGLEEQV